MESGVAKHTSEDSQDSRVQFITPAGPRGIGSQQGPGRWLRRTQFYTPLLCITGYVSNVSQHAGTGELTVTTCRFRRYRYPNWDHLTFASSLCHLWGGGLIPIALLPVAPTGSQRDGHDWAHPVISYVLYRKHPFCRKKVFFSTPNKTWERTTENTPKERKALRVVSAFLTSSQGTRQQVFQI